MKKFVKPLIEVIDIDLDDIITTSQSHIGSDEDLPSDEDFDW